MTDSTHECPAPGCTRRVGKQYLFCRTHWLKVPRDLARELYAAWDLGRGEGTARHNVAVIACTEWFERY